MTAPDRIHLTFATDASGDTRIDKASPERFVGSSEYVRADVSRLKELLCPTSDWDEALEDLNAWTASAFLAGERVKDVDQHKVDLRGFLNSIRGHFLCAQEATQILEALPPAPSINGMAA